MPQTTCTSCLGAGSFKCSRCAGSGVSNLPCPVCGGAGRAPGSNGSETCSRCAGSGSTSSSCAQCVAGKERCVRCGGRGSV